MSKRYKFVNIRVLALILEGNTDILLIHIRPHFMCFSFMWRLIATGSQIIVIAFQTADEIEIMSPWDKNIYNKFE